MNSNKSKTSKRKKEHLELCLTDAVSFKRKSTGFENYEFKHYPITEVDITKLDFRSKFFGKKINFPFLISCMTGGTSEAENINAQLAIVAEELIIPIGVGSQRQALEDKDFVDSFKTVRKNAPNVPVLGNIGAAQVVQFKSVDPVKKLVDMIEANAMVIHINPLQELLQKEGETIFTGLLKKIRMLVKKLGVPVIIKEVGSGISKEAAVKLLEAGVRGIDVSGAGGTSWAGVEILRNKDSNENVFWDWGLPTSYCIKEVFMLKKNYKFTLIGSGGIKNGLDSAKAFALGADVVASARLILQALDNSGVEGTVKYINKIFDEISKIMYLTGSHNLKELRNNKLIKKELFY
ncbi:MAG: type 2 isopentenyl-diphosphate Delta-isomerase [Bacteroidetes bacterium]|nr:type 2 isopentenyl-diphosphate Delta-isomerase [Bacteroidota bacterium]